MGVSFALEGKLSNRITYCADELFAWSFRWVGALPLEASYLIESLFVQTSFLPGVSGAWELCPWRQAV